MYGNKELATSNWTTDYPGNESIRDERKRDSNWLATYVDTLTSGRLKIFFALEVNN